MNFLMNINFNHEIAAQRRQALTEAADRHRMRRWFPSKRAQRNSPSGPTGGRVIPFSNPAGSTVSAVDAAAATAAVTPAAAVGDLEHASARVA